MDSLFSNYASSDEEEDRRPGKAPPPPSSSSRLVAHSAPKSSFSSSLPVPRSTSSIFSSLPPPSSVPSSHSSSTFSSLPLPKPKLQDTNPKPRRVVQLKLPILTSPIVDDDDDEDDDRDYGREEIKAANSSAQTFSASSFLSNILPAPKYATSLGALPSASGRGRRSIIDADIRSSSSTELNTKTNPAVVQDSGNYEGKTVDGSSAAASGDTSSWVPYGGNYDDPSYPSSGGNYDDPSYPSSGGNYENYTNSSGYDTYGDHSAANIMATHPNMAESMVKITGKRGRRSDVPLDIVEVKQDDLMKNRPRVDQSKSTGIAFGPSYQPVSTKGKPSKLHKRKHQISSLFFDMKQNESELAERRSRGFLTKAQTQGKYGW